VPPNKRKTHTPTPSHLSVPFLSLSLSQIRLAHSLRQRNEPNEHANLPARTEARCRVGSTRRRLFVLAERRLQFQGPGHIARLAEVGVGVDLVGDARRPVCEVFGVRLAPVVAARVIGLHGAFAAASAHFLDEVGVGDGNGAQEVGLGLVDIAEAGDEGGRADRVGHAADWGGGLVWCCVGRAVGGWARRTLAIVGLLGHDGVVG